MTVSSIRPVNNHKGNYSSKEFDFDFLIEHEEELVVTHISATGVTNILTCGRDYTINEIGNPKGSSIIFPIESSSYSVLGEREVLSLSLSLEIKQESKFENSSFLNLKVLEWTFDYIIRLIQMLSSKLDMAVIAQEGSRTGPKELLENLNNAQKNAELSAQQSVSSAKNALELSKQMQKDIDAAKEDITDLATNINISIPLFESKYSEYELYNASWLKSAGQWNNKSVYVSMYEALEVERNPEIQAGVEADLPSGEKYIKRGISVKLSTDSDITDYDFVINKENQTFRLPLLNGSETALSDKYDQHIIQASGTQYVAPANGFIYIGFSQAGADSSTVRVTNITKNIFYDHSVPKSTNGLHLLVPIERGEQFSIVYTAINKDYFWKFYYAKANGSLYYYAGATVQNKNMLNAGKISEELSAKTNMLQASGACIPSDKSIKYELGTSGSVYTAPANGRFRLVKESTAADQYLLLSRTRYYESSIGGNSDMCSFQLSAGKWRLAQCVEIDVRKDEKIFTYYDFGGRTIVFEFRPYEGSK